MRILTINVSAVMLQAKQFEYLKSNSNVEEQIKTKDA